ncbi:MAG: hypothetical protein J5596_01295 [Bacteroidaceae bacterium]|nr:hypothetical protein [Bacteroidaceae bacterium]
MKKLLVLLSALLLQAAAVCVFAQDKPKSGDVIRGIVRNSDGPMAGVQIEEIDFYDEYHDSICSKAVTDENGEFSLRLVSPENELLFHCMDYISVWVKDISESYYEINMDPQPPLNPVMILDGPEHFTVLPPVESDKPLTRPEAGTTISGYIRGEGDGGPLEKAYVMEIAGVATLVELHYTDENGFFSFEIKDPNNFLMISYIGHETIKVAIDRTEFDITLKGRKDMPTVDVAADKKKVLY